MSRKGCPNKNQSGISYPRKCEHCEYISNNPSMYSYHKHTHDNIPLGQLCDHGCGGPALVKGTGGKYTCLPKYQLCPAYISQLAIRTKLSWADSDERKQKTKETFITHCSGNIEIRAKSKATIKKKWGNFTPEQMKDFRHYARRIRARAQAWAKAQGYVLGPLTYHVDHKLSIYDAWASGLPESIVNHPANLQIMTAKENCRKGAKSSMTVNELLIVVNMNLLCEK